MRRCENCKAEILFEDVQFCEHCGATLAPEPQRATEDGDDFVVTEAASEQSDSDARRRPRNGLPDDLGVQSSAEVVQNLSLDGDEDISVDSPTTETSHSMSEVPSPQESAAAGQVPPDGVKRLSPEELRSVEKNLYSTANYLTEEEKQNLLKTVQSAGGTSDSHQPKARKASAPVEMTLNGGAELTRPTMAKKGRGIAYFVKNYIQVKGDVELHDNDEIQINDRSFLLRKKRLSPKAAIATAATAFALVLVALGAIFMTGDHGTNGEIVGLALDANHQPFIHGAAIRLPDIGRTYTTNAQGFFRTDHIPSGSYKIEYIVDGQSVATDYATVAAGEITTIALKPGMESPSAPATDTYAANQVASEYDQTRSGAASSQTAPPVSSEQASRQQPDRRTEASKLTLAANVEGARLSLDGAVIGAGNLTYSKIRPGKHNYTVSKDGYVTVAGSIDIGSGETQVLEVALSPAATEPAKPADNLAIAQAAIKEKRFGDAITLLGEEIGRNPNRSQCYRARAEAYVGDLNKAAACEDYLKAAELSRKQNDNGQAMNDYGGALKCNPKCVPALLGRAQIYLARNEEIAAIADYESVINLDKKNAEAYYGIGEARFNQGNYKQAIKYFKDARSIDPNNPAIHQYLMLAYLGDDDLKNVRKSYDKFMELASQEQKHSIQSDKRFDAILRVVAQEQ